MKIDKKYISYAEAVLSGKIVACEYIKLACQRYLSFFEREDMYFDEKAVDKVINFISKLKHFTGEHNGKPFILSDWQEWIIYSIYGFKWKKDNNMGCLDRKKMMLSFNSWSSHIRHANSYHIYQKIYREIENIMF